MAALSSVTDVTSAAAWANVGGDPKDEMTLLGKTLGLLGKEVSLRDIAFIPQNTWDSLVAGIKLGDLPVALTAVQLSQLAQFKFAAEHSAVPGSGAGSSSSPTKLGSGAPPVFNVVTERNTKHISDLFGSSDIALVRLEKQVIAGLYQDFRTARGDFPSRDVEPSEDQLSAVYLLIAGKYAIYVDFALFGPYNSKFQDKIKYGSSRFDPITQEWNKVELPGPRSIDDWNRCWAVFECCLLLLKTVPPETIQAYARYINRLAAQYGHQCWFIIYQADVLMRSDHMDRIKRSASAGVIKTVDGSEFLRESPWPQVFSIASSDIHPQATAFWTENVHHPAMRFIINSQGFRAPKESSSLPPPGKVAKLNKPDLCKDYVNGRCFGSQCPQGLAHPPCPFCFDYHAKSSCPFKGKSTKSPASSKSASGLPPPPPPPGALPAAGADKSGGGKGKGGKGKGGKKGKGSKSRR